MNIHKLTEGGKQKKKNDNLGGQLKIMLKPLVWL